MQKRFLKYDLFKLIVLIQLVILLLVIKNQKQAAVPSDGIDSSVQAKGEEDSLSGEDEAEVGHPEFPLNDGSLVLDNEGSGLLDSDGVLRFQLDEGERMWIPVIPNEIKLELPDGFQLTVDESNIWHIVDVGGSVLYTFNLSDLKWAMVNLQMDASEPEPTILECVGANPIRISGVGTLVKVVNAMIPLRSSPDAVSANYLLPLQPGTVLEVTEDPICTMFLDGANQWWGVRTESGIEGFAAEGSAVSDVYYLQELD